MPWQTDFFVEATAGILGVFIGVLLALWTDRRRQASELRRQSDRELQEMGDVKRVVLASVVKNTIEVKRLKSALLGDQDPYLLGVNLERAVWEATQSHFVRLAPLDDRILLSRFFDQVRRVSGLLDFFREARADEMLQAGPQAHRTSADIARRLAEVAEDVRLDGIVIVTDLGDDAQKRLLGLAPPAAEPI